MKLHKLPVAENAAENAAAEPIAAETLIHGAPMTKTWVHYEAPGGSPAAGIWQATPGKWRIAYDEWEYVVMISGACIITGDDGSIIHAKAGDAFVIEPGFTGSWEVTETMRKHWVIETP